MKTTGSIKTYVDGSYYFDLEEKLIKNSKIIYDLKVIVREDQIDFLIEKLRSLKTYLGDIET